FAAGMSGFLMLLSTASRERLQMWGQLVTFRYIRSADETETGPDTRELAASGRRIGLAAICLAVIVPIVLPTLQPQQLFGTGSGTPHSGPGGGGTLDPMLQVQRELQEKNPRTVLTYTTTAPDPASQYFQVYVLTYRPKLDTWVPQFSGSRTGLAGTGDESLPYSPTGQLATTPAQTVSTTVTLALGQGTPLYLPVPYAPVRLKLPGRTATPGWAEMAGTLMLYNNELPELGALPYTVTSTETNPKPTDITAATETTPNYIANQYGFYNGPDRDQLLAIVNQHIGRAQTSLERALLLQTWLLSGSFRYSVNPKLPSTHWLRTFLTTRKRGYCQQFAWAFAVLARLAGIPSRIAVGYTAGTRGQDGKWRVSTADAHAWPELYFPGEGWLRFEPTPHGTTGQGTATVPTYATGNPAGGPGSLTPNGQPTAGAVGGRPPANPAGQQKPSIGLPGGFGGSPAAAAGSWIAVGLPIVALLLLLSPALARRLTRRRRWLAASGDAATAVAAWRELSDDLTDYGLARGPGETPR
ncbi:MAG: transglutaminase domain-containing protein, partial [Actinobacteria bacterium]|nr:transglutaminase domain-containing protein [Actinomycetota bacterium]